MVEVSFPLPVHSQHSVQVRAEDHSATVDARVRHIRPAMEMGRFLVGLEFSAPEPVLVEALGHPAAGQEPI